MIHEAARQLPSGVVPDAVLCSVGGGGLLGGVIRGMNEVGWNQSALFNVVILYAPALHALTTYGVAQIITFETHGSNCFHLSLLANSDDPAASPFIPEGTVLSEVPPLSDLQRVRFSAVPCVE